jgi:hypothetical protein
MYVDRSCGLWQFISCSNHKTECQKLTNAVPQNKGIPCSAGSLQASPHLCAVCICAQLCDKHCVFVLDTLHSTMWNAAAESAQNAVQTVTVCHSISNVSVHFRHSFMCSGQWKFCQHSANISTNSKPNHTVPQLSAMKELPR